MPTILIQAGHSAKFPPYQTGGGGAPGEADWTSDLATRLAARLSTRGVTVTLVGCWSLDNSNPPQGARADYDLFLSLHYDAAIYPENTGCLAGRATSDPCGAAADRFIAGWQATYPAATGIPLRQDRLNPNVTDYYAFRVTSPRTPGVLIEHGVGQGLDHEALFTHMDAIADADAAAVVHFLGIQEKQVSAEDQALLDAVKGSGIADAQAYTDLVNWTSETYKELQDEQAQNAQLSAALAAQAQSAPAVVKVLAPAGVQVDVEPAGS